MSVANIHALTVQFFRPERVKCTIERLWTPGTDFVDLVLIFPLYTFNLSGKT